MYMRKLAYCPRKGEEKGTGPMQEGMKSLRQFAVAAAVFSALLSAGCASSLDAIPPISDTASFADVQEQLLRAGDAVRVVVYGRDELSGVYKLGKDGLLDLGSVVGRIQAKGLTAAQLEQQIAGRLAEKGVHNARVSVMID